MSSLLLGALIEIDGKFGVVLHILDQPFRLIIGILDFDLETLKNVNPEQPSTGFDLVCTAWPIDGPIRIHHFPEEAGIAVNQYVERLKKKSKREMFL